MSRASWAAATSVQRAQAEAYAEIVNRIPYTLGLPRRVRESSTPHLDHLVAEAPRIDGDDVASAVFTVAIEMVGRTHASDAADDLVRLAPEVHARRMSPLDVRNIAVARSARAAQAEKATDLVAYTQIDVFEVRPHVIPASPMLSPELIETITDYAEAVYGRPLTDTMRRRLDIGVPCVVEFIERYPVRNAEPGAVLVSMQAQQSSRHGRHLPTVFREMKMDERVAVALTRVLVGCGRDPRTAILWHAVRHTPPELLANGTVARLRRDISDLDQAQFADELARAWLRRRLTREVNVQWADRPCDAPKLGRTAFGD